LDPIIDAFMDRLSGLISQYAEHVSSGSLEDYAYYQRSCGTIDGLRMAEREMKELVSKVMSEDDGI